MTAFTWHSGETDRAAFIRRSAEVFHRELQECYPSGWGLVESVWVEGEPQLAFSLTVFAETEADARRRATFRFEKALTTNAEVGGRQRRLLPPWGKATVTET